jgi:hypothetical protein
VDVYLIHTAHMKISLKQFRAYNVSAIFTGTAYTATRLFSDRLTTYYYNDITANSLGVTSRGHRSLAIRGHGTTVLVPRNTPS